jgi:hypothetical protein
MARRAAAAAAAIFCAIANSTESSADAAEAAAGSGQRSLVATAASGRWLRQLLWRVEVKLQGRGAVRYDYPASNRYMWDYVQIQKRMKPQKGER